VQFFRLLLIALSASVLASRHASAFTEMPIEYARQLVWVKVHLEPGGRPLNFVLDSGAGRSVIDSAVARQLNLRVLRSQSVIGVGGRADAREVTGFNAAAAGHRVPSSLLAMDLGALGKVCGRRMDGLLGLDFFRHRIIEIDYATRRLRLLERGEFAARGGETLPLAARNDALCLQVAIAGQPADWMRLDTGCTSALEWVETRRSARGSRVATVAFESQRGAAIRADAALGARLISGVEVSLLSHPLFAGEAGLVGNGLLSRFVVTLDVDRRRCLIS
jgi:hypothetical protein